MTMLETSSLVKRIGIKNVWAILNKVPSDEIVARLQTELRRRNIPVAGCLHFDSEVFSLSIEGSVPTDGRAMEEIRDIWDSTLAGAGIQAANRRH
jgi:CO dehydrogenase nickel-insertion accessory protein CooC1